MKYFLQRLGFYLIAFFAAITINFFLPRMMPGDPVQSYIASLYSSGGNISAETVKAIEKLFGFVDQPLWKSYLDYIWSMLNGDWGVSLKYYPAPVVSTIFDYLPWTLFLVGSSVVISYIITTFLGIFVAWNRGGVFDSVVTITGQILANIPAIVTALALSMIFARQLDLFPTGGSYDAFNWELTPGFNWPFIKSVLYYAVLPATAIIITSLGNIMVMRANMINQLGEDYIVMGWGKGVPDRKVMFAYGARNALLPLVTSFAMCMGYIFGGSIVIEMVFNYPGLGQLMFQALAARDYPLIQGLLLLITTLVLSMNFFADVVVFFLDPRLRKQGK